MALARSLSRWPLVGRTLSCAALALVVASTAFAQSTASLAGSVTDREGASIEGAEVRVVEQRTALARQTRSNGRGLYSFANLPPGSYVVEASKDGFQSARTQPLSLNVNDRREAPLTLEPEGGSTPVVTVEATGEGAAPLGSTVVNERFVADLPLNGRSFQNLIAMTPGVVQTPANETSWGQLSLIGQRNISTYYTVDGVSANFGVPISYDGSTPASDGVLPSLSALGSTNGLVAVDALRELKVETTAYEAEYGRGVGGQISMATRSGTNELHGSLFEYFRNERLDANNWFSNRSGLGRSALRLNDFGGVLGGPIVPNRTFFFGAYEHFTLREPHTASQLVPTLEARTRAAPNVRPVLDAFPIPNRPALGGGLAEFVGGYSNPSSMDAWSVRVDEALTSTVLLFGRISDSPSSLTQRGPEGASPSLINNYGLINARSTAATIGSIQMLGAAVSNEVRVNYSRASVVMDAYLDDLGGGVPPDLVQYFPAGVTPEHGRIGVIDLSGLPSLGAGSIADVRQGQWNVVDTMTLLRGGHEIKAGLDFRRLTPFYEDPQYSALAIFNGLEGPVGLLGGMPAVTQIDAYEAIRLHQINWSAFVQDRWRLAPRTMLTLGVRWDYNPAPTSGNNLPLYPLKGVTNPAEVGLGSASDPLFRAEKDLFAPRVAIAHRWLEGSPRALTLRAGFGLFHDLPVGAVQAAKGGSPYRRSVAYPFPYNGALDPPPIQLDPPFATLRGMDPNLRNPTSLQWNVSLTAGMGAGQSLRIGYLGSLGRDLLQREGAVAPSDTVGQLDVVRSTGRSNYNSLQVQFERQLTRGIQFSASHTWSHSFDTSSDSINMQRLLGDPARISYGSSDFDIHHLTAGAVSWQVPYFPGPLDILTRGWSVESIFRFQTGLPINVYSQAQVNGFVRFRPNLVPGQAVWLVGDQYPGGRALNPDAFQPVDGAHGNLGRNALRAFPLDQVDLAVRRAFRITEGVRLHFGGEFFNVLNTPSFASPPSNLSGTGFGVSNTTFARGLGGGGLFAGQNPLFAAGGARSIQLLLRLSF